MPSPIEKLLSSPVLSLPRERSEHDFKAYLASLLNSYLKKVKKLPAEDKLSSSILKQLPKIEKLCNSINVVILKYLEGFPREAYNEFQRGIRPILNQHAGKLLKPRSQIDKNLYRMRIGSRATLDKDDLHFPTNSGRSSKSVNCS